MILTLTLIGTLIVVILVWLVVFNSILQARTGGKGY